jgi:hypothetical protein
MFVLCLFYEVIQNERGVNEAFQIVKTMDEEMLMYQIYENYQ